MLRHFSWTDIELEIVNPQVKRQHVVTESTGLARMFMKKGWVVPLHDHISEQITFVQKGALKFKIDSKEIVVSEGEILCIPPSMPHEAVALEDTEIFDVFNPPRSDWVAGTDSYLRHSPNK